MGVSLVQPNCMGSPPVVAAADEADGLSWMGPDAAEPGWEGGGERCWVPMLSVQLDVQFGGKEDEAFEVFGAPAECHCILQLPVQAPTEYSTEEKYKRKNLWTATGPNNVSL